MVISIWESNECASERNNMKGGKSMCVVAMALIGQMAVNAVRNVDPGGILAFFIAAGLWMVNGKAVMRVVR